MRDLSSKRPQPLIVRLLHWSQIPVLLIMASSGFQILFAYPFIGPRGALFGWHPFQGWRPPEWLRSGEWLAGARHLHFAFGWGMLVIGAVYVVWLASTGEWRRRVFNPRRDVRGALTTAWDYLRLKKTVRGSELYNGLQRLAYSSVLLVLVLEVWSGLVLYKPVQLKWLGGPLGGYEGARVLHFYGLAFIALFTVVHVVMVLLHPTTLWDMITGGKPREAIGAATSSRGEPHEQLSPRAPPDPSASTNVSRGQPHG